MELEYGQFQLSAKFIQRLLASDEGASSLNSLRTYFQTDNSQGLRAFVTAAYSEGHLPPPSHCVRVKRSEGVGELKEGGEGVNKGLSDMEVGRQGRILNTQGELQGRGGRFFTSVVSQGGSEEQSRLAVPLLRHR